MKMQIDAANPADLTAEIAEWLEAFDEVVVAEGPEQGAELLAALRHRARSAGISTRGELTTPYLNTIPKHEELPYPGDLHLERRIRSLIRWNAMAMVHSQNKHDAGIGGHISTYSSLATLLEVGFNHFFHATYGDQPGDFIYFQGHASPGVYARSFLEGRFDETRLEHFRHELRDTPGLSSYPHPWLMPDFWRFPTVSMGIGPLNAIYQARFMRYLENRNLIEKTPRKIWAFVGDGETDEVDTLGALGVASREKLDNLIFVVNCNLQRLDGPVRGNKRIIDELEEVFLGFGWNVIKVIWGGGWDKLFERDHKGLLLKRMEECVDGDYQAFKAKGGAYIRSEFFGKYPELLDMVSDMTDDEIFHMMRGGHDPVKVYNAYKRAIEHTGRPTVILAKTVKGYGLASTQARNASHQEKKLTDDALEAFVNRFEIPIPFEDAKKGKFYRPAPDSPEIVYLQEHRQKLGGYMPDARRQAAVQFQGARTRLLRRMDRRLQRPRRLDHHGLRQHAAPPHERQRDRQADRPHRSRRRPHLRPRVGDPPGRHLRARGTKVQAARRRHAALLPRRERRPDPGRRHHRSRLHGLLHRRRNRLLQLSRAHDSLLHVLLDVRLPARRRYDLGLRRLARPRLPHGRHRRPHHHARRGPAASGRPQPRALQHGAELPQLRSGLRL